MARLLPFLFLLFLLGACASSEDDSPFATLGNGNPTYVYLVENTSQGDLYILEISNGIAGYWREDGICASASLASNSVNATLSALQEGGQYFDDPDGLPGADTLAVFQAGEFPLTLPKSRAPSSYSAIRNEVLNAISGAQWTQSASTDDPTECLPTLELVLDSL